MVMWAEVQKSEQVVECFCFHQSGQQSESPSRFLRGNLSGLRDPASPQTAADGSHLDRVAVRHAAVPREVGAAKVTSEVGENWWRKQVFVWVQVSEELSVAAGLCRNGLRTDSPEPV